MEIIVFEKEAYFKLQAKLFSMFKEALIEANSELKKQSLGEDLWLSTKEAKELLGVRSKTKMQQLRDCGNITFSKHGRIIKYSKNSILEYLENHKNK